MQPKCSKCGSDMQEGFIVDKGYNCTTRPSWVAGKPQKSWLGTEVDGKTQYPIQTFRCIKCGLLESYVVDY